MVDLEALWTMVLEADDDNIEMAIQAGETLKRLQFNYEWGYPHFFLAKLYLQIGEFEKARQACLDGFSFWGHEEWLELLWYAQAECGPGNLPKTNRLIKKAIKYIDLASDAITAERYGKDFLSLQTLWNNHKTAIDFFEALKVKIPEHGKTWNKMQEWV